MRLRSPGWILCFVLHLAAAPVVAQVAEADSTARLFRTRDLVYAGVFFGSLLAVEPFEGIDDGLSPDSDPTGLAGDLSEAGDTFGKGYVAYGLGGIALLGGELFGESRLSRVGLSAIGALAASDLIVFPTKVIVGRRRPLANGGETDHFDSFAFEREFYSFPSGHTAHAFALAVVVSDEFAHEAPWVPYVAYPVAFLTAASRVIGREHWVTDVIAGAAAGLFAGKFADRLFGRHDGRQAAENSVKPVLSTGDGAWTVGVTARIR